MSGLIGVQFAAIGATALFLGVALFQIALALGLPLGGATFGGAAPTVDGVLSTGFRLIAVLSAMILLGFSWIFLARAGLVSTGFVSERFLVWACWAIVIFLIVNTVGNISAPHPVERYVMGSVTILLAILCSVIALRAPLQG